jgi:hypothetical protein
MKVVALQTFVSLSWKGDLCWENVRSTSHYTSLTCLMSLTLKCFMPSESTSPQIYIKSLNTLNTLFLFKHWQFFLTASVFELLILLSFS